MATGFFIIMTVELSFTIFKVRAYRNLRLELFAVGKSQAFTVDILIVGTYVRRSLTLSILS